ncbi:helix-turn-helix domain-containing protein [Streptomonospora sp. S1-112]|uniref:Helix-turn-helix domain-containing protein n=1 Tax=Streptomonospora mangrovi TaxID=2883123 RepID=A0A9X3SPI8_9ACTN|nr:helix-turn-helix domain-containing protein [Streptomonospora mangrovi]MDA0565946.1 helix-turn-helix domain-containing protein [Streptomonospora mangrovi]
MSTPHLPPRFYTPAEVQNMFRVSHSTVRRWTEEGHLRTVRTLGGHRRIYADDVDALLRGEEAPHTCGG